MNSAMLAAIKNKKSQGLAIEGDHQESTHSSLHADDKSKDLHGFVASLSDQEKGKLQHILNTGGNAAMDIAKGAASSEERGKIDSAIQTENQENSLQAQQDQAEHPDVDSDEIQKSMLDHKSIASVGSDMKPRNLGERAKMSAAKNLKAKGKI